MQEDKQNQQEKPQESALDASISWLSKWKDVGLNAAAKLANLEQTNFELGLRYLNSGAFKDAIIRFKIVLWLNPKNPYAHYLLGKSYVYAGKYEKAVEPLKIALKAKPEMEEAQFFLAVCGVGEVPKRVPPSIMIEQLENIAEIFEVQIANGVNRAAYSIGTKMLHDAMKGQQGFDVLDLDIRTGKSGDFVLPLANNIVGVEPCMHLISQARNRRIEDKLVYNELITKTAEDLLKKEERQFDVVQAYFSSLAFAGLTKFFELVAARLRPNKYFLLSVEGTAGKGFSFNNVRMSFAHSAEYIQEIAKKTGFEVVAQQSVNQQNPSADLVFLLKKKN